MTRTWPAPRVASGPAPAGTSARRLAPVVPMRAPLLAVCGLCGGAGASTLTYLVARYAVERGLGHVLAFDTGGTTGGLSAICGVETQLRTRGCRRMRPSRRSAGIGVRAGSGPLR